MKKVSLILSILAVCAAAAALIVSLTTPKKSHQATESAITTEAVNALGEKVQLRLCSNPTKAADDIYERLKYKKMPFRRRLKVCSTQQDKPPGQSIGHNKNLKL